MKRLSMNEFLGAPNFSYSICPTYPDTQQHKYASFFNADTKLDGKANTGRWLSTADEHGMLVLYAENKIPFVLTQPWLNAKRKNNIIYSKTPIQNLINQVRLGNKAFTQHPFSEEILFNNYLYDAKVACYANDKSKLSDFTDHHPKRKICHTIELPNILKDLIAPCIIKKSSASAGGDGICICRNQDDIKKITKFLKGANQFIIEEFIENDIEINAQFIINQNGTITPLGFAEKRVKNGIFLGGLINTNTSIESLDQELRIILYNCVNKLKNIGVIGTVGLDVWEKNKKIFDINARLNGNTGWHGNKESISNFYGTTLLKTISIMGSTITINDLKTLIKKGVIVVSGGAIESGQFKLYAGIPGNTIEEISKNEKIIAGKNIIIK